MLMQPRRGSCEEPGRQDEAVGGDDDGIGQNGRQGGARRLCVVGEATVQAQAARLQHLDAALDGERLHRRRQRLHAATGRPIGLAQDANDLEAGADDPFEGDPGEFRRARERQPQRAGAQGRASSRVFFSMRVRMRERLSGLRYSTKTLPSR